MVEIIKRGVPYADRTFEIKCWSCRSKLRYKGAEVQRDYHYMPVITCPACGSSFDVTKGVDVTPVSNEEAASAPHAFFGEIPGL